MDAPKSSVVDLNLIAVFVQVIETGSFTGAAAALGIPKSSVSRAVTRLEETLGVRLLQRTTRRLGLTAAGDQYLAQVRRPIAELAEASRDTAELTGEPRGLVRISIPPELGEGVASKLFAEFVRRHPKVQLDVLVTNRRVNLVEEGVDLALRAGPLDDSTLVARKVVATELRLYAAPAYLARRGTPRRLRDLASHDCVIHRSARGVLPWRLSGPRGVEQITVSGPISVDDMGSSRLLALEGVGIALLPDQVVRADLEVGSLVHVLPAYALALQSAGLHVVTPPLRHVPLRVSLFRDFLIERLIARFRGTPCAVGAARQAAPSADRPSGKAAKSAAAA